MIAPSMHEKANDMTARQDVVLVSRVFAPSTKARAEQIAAMWSRAELARFRCPGKGICATVPWACADRGPPNHRCRQGKCALGRFLIVHVKFACFNLFEYFPNAVHVYDPVDTRPPRAAALSAAVQSVSSPALLPKGTSRSRAKRAGADRDAEWDRLANFSGVVALSLAHRRQLLLAGARRVWVLGMHSIAAAGCPAIPQSQRDAMDARLPLRPAPAGGCPRANDYGAMSLARGGWAAPPASGGAALSGRSGGLPMAGLGGAVAGLLPLRVLIMGDSHPGVSHAY
jgi:hypothetical protein